MSENKNVLMNVNGMNFYINDDNYKHFKSLQKPQQELIKQRMIRNFDMINNLHMFPDDEIVKYLQTLPKLNKDSIKHMIISYYKHFESLPKPQQELTKKITIRNYDMSNIRPFFFPS